jgi:hypothetical protein
MFRVLLEENVNKVKQGHRSVRCREYENHSALPKRKSGLPRTYVSERSKRCDRKSSSSKRKLKKEGTVHRIQAQEPKNWRNHRDA